MNVDLPGLLDIVERSETPEPWAEGEKIPWDAPEFSQRMLAEHLTDRHDAASRRASTIDVHVDWIHNEILNSRQSRVLDLGCGPGLYTSRLSALGHQCVGIDFSPASIEYAASRTGTSADTTHYIQADVREADYGRDFDLVMFVHGEFNVFRRTDAELILRKANAALRPGGQILLEVHTAAFVRSEGESGASWTSHRRGLFSSRPHLLLVENFWHERESAATVRYFVIDTESATVDWYASSMQAYTDADYRELITSAGFDDISRFE
ncbi:MAG: class I SAM-dependent methyltransferase, partial [Chloroflexota bacterium]